MLFYHLYLVKYLCIGMLVISLFITLCAAVSYSTNSQRSDDDPEKKSFSPGAVILVFFTWPVLLAGIISLFLLRAAVYGVFIFFFIVFLLFIPRQRKEPLWVERATASIGDKLLEANTFLIRLLLRPWSVEPELP